MTKLRAKIRSLKEKTTLNIFNVNNTTKLWKRV